MSQICTIFLCCRGKDILPSPSFADRNWPGLEDESDCFDHETYEKTTQNERHGEEDEENQARGYKYGSTDAQKKRQQRSGDDDEQQKSESPEKQFEWEQQQPESSPDQKPAKFDRHDKHRHGQQ
ncbi:unnamed protein product, partial [marine sediment metagenome]